MPGGCQRCSGGICVGASCWFDCRPVGENECETLVMGGYGDMEVEALTTEAKSKLAQFLPCFRIEQCTELMSKAGLKVGMFCTHINGKFPEGLDDFVEMVRHLPKGTVFKVWEGSERKDIKL